MAGGRTMRGCDLLVRWMGAAETALNGGAELDSFGHRPESHTLPWNERP